MGNTQHENNQSEQKGKLQFISQFTYSHFLNGIPLQNALTIDSRVFLKKQEEPVDSDSLNGLSESFKHLVNLRCLSVIMRECKFSEECLKQFGQSLLQLTNLQILEIEFSTCSMNVSQVIALMSGISQMHWIQTLKVNLKKNELTNEGIFQIAQHLAQLKQLTDLQLFIHENPFSDKSIDFLIDTLVNKLLKLKVIFVDIQPEYKLLESAILQIQKNNDKVSFDSGNETS